jgi:hypothetical protein
MPPKAPSQLPWEILTLTPQITTPAASTSLSGVSARPPSRSLLDTRWIWHPLPVPNAPPTPFQSDWVAGPSATSALKVSTRRPPLESALVALLVATRTWLEAPAARNAQLDAPAPSGLFPNELRTRNVHGMRQGMILPRQGGERCFFSLAELPETMRPLPTWCLQSGAAFRYI